MLLLLMVVSCCILTLTPQSSDSCGAGEVIYRVCVFVCVSLYTACIACMLATDLLMLSPCSYLLMFPQLILDVCVLVNEKQNDLCRTLRCNVKDGELGEYSLISPQLS